MFTPIARSLLRPRENYHKGMNLSFANALLSASSQSTNLKFLKHKDFSSPLPGLCVACNYLSSPSPVVYCCIVMLPALVFSLVKHPVPCLVGSLLVAQKARCCLVGMEVNWKATIRQDPVIVKLYMEQNMEGDTIEKTTGSLEA